MSIVYPYSKCWVQDYGAKGTMGLVNVTTSSHEANLLDDDIL